MNKKVYRNIKDSIQRYLDLLWKAERTNDFLIWTESDIQAYLYSCLTREYGHKYSINTNPPLSSRTKKYKAKGIKPFYQPDILITPIRNLTIEEEYASPKKQKRMVLRKKDDSIVVEIKFVQDTYSSYSRPSKTTLGELVEDYEKNKQEGHKFIILVFFEKGEKSYLTENDIKTTLRRFRSFTVFHKPKKTSWN